MIAEGWLAVLAASEMQVLGYFFFLEDKHALYVTYFKQRQQSKYTKTPSKTFIEENLPRQNSVVLELTDVG